MSDPLFWHRLQFAFTIVYHYLFPQLTMGLALLIVVLKAVGLRTGDARWDDAARFWIRIFGINFAVGVVTGIPMEFQFGTNWAAFSRYAGGVIGQTLAMEGLFAFFLESTLPRPPGLRRAPSRAGAVTSLAALALFAGSWLSGYFIIATNAFMQHPVGHDVAADGTLGLASFWTFLLNPWALAQYAHTMVAAVVTASFVMAAVGAYYALHGRPSPIRRASFCGVGVDAGLVASVLVAFPTGDRQAKLVARHQPVALAAMEGRFESGPQRRHHHDRPAQRRRATARQSRSDPGHAQLPRLRDVPQPTCRGSTRFRRTSGPTTSSSSTTPSTSWPDSARCSSCTMAIAAVLLVARTARSARPMLWVLMLAFPFPYIAKTAGWMTAELGRQPWLVYGLMRTARRGESDGPRRHRALHADRLHRALLRARPALPVPDRTRDRARARAARRPVASCPAQPRLRGAPWLNSGSPSPR